MKSVHAYIIRHYFDAAILQRKRTRKRNVNLQKRYTSTWIVIPNSSVHKYTCDGKKSVDHQMQKQRRNKPPPVYNGTVKPCGKQQNVVGWWRGWGGGRLEFIGVLEITGVETGAKDESVIRYYRSPRVWIWFSTSPDKRWLFEKHYS